MDGQENKKTRRENADVDVQGNDDVDQEGNDDDLLTLSLSFPGQARTPPPPPPEMASLNQYHQNVNVPLVPYPPLSVPFQLPSAPPAAPAVAPVSSVMPRHRRNPTQIPKRKGKETTVPAPYRWATTRRATVHTLEHILVSEGIETITGDVQCKRCEKQFELGFNLREKFMEVGSFVAKNKGSMHDRAPSVWMNPILLPCRFCQQENSAKPVLDGVKKREINWLFLLLGQWLGCCTLKQLKYFCKHTKNHRTGAKDRVLYLAYLELCKQLDPNGPFDR